MHNNKKGTMRRVLAGILSAAMLLTTDSQAVFAASLSQPNVIDSIAIPGDISACDLTVSGADAIISAGDSIISAEEVVVSTGDAAASVEDATVSTGDATAPVEDATASAGNASVSAGDAAAPAVSVAFTLTPADIQYGEDGSNKTGNLDALFAPGYVAEGNVLTLNEDYTVTYKFFTEEIPGDASAFVAADCVRLETIPAGTLVTVCALAESTSGSAQFATAVFTVSKRKVVVRYTVSKEDALDGREVPEDGQLVIPQADILPENLTVSIAEDMSTKSSFAAEDELNAALADAIDGDLTLDVSDVDVTEDGYQVVPMEFSLEPNFDDNYEIVGNIFGDVYVKKATYYVTFTVNNEGEQWTKTYTQEYNTKKAVKDYSFYSEMTSAVNTLLAKSENTELVGWSVYTDSFNVSSKDAGYNRNHACNVFLNPDASTYEYNSTTYTFDLTGTCDYHFVAQVSRAAAEQLYVTTIPSVYYDGRAHVALGTKVNARKQAADLCVAVYAAGSSTPLTPGKDFTVAYKNNTKASMKLVREGGNIGSYVPLYDPKAESNKRPKVIITGKGSHKGFSAEVYFDILPVSLGATENMKADIAEQNNATDDSYAYYYPYTETYSSKAMLSGFATSYLLKKASKIKAPKVTKEFYTYGDDANESNINKETGFINKLKEGTDYVLEFYRYDHTEKKWKKQTETAANKLTEEGDYLCVVRGIGNYCGAVYDDEYSWADEEYEGFDNFNPEGQGGDVNPSFNLSSGHQFRLTANKEDMKYDFSTVKITIGKKSMPFTVNESGSPKRYRETDFDITVKNSSGETLVLNTDYFVSYAGKYRQSWVSYPDSADEYTVYVSPTSFSDYYGSRRIAGKVRITGLKLKSNYFKLSSKTAALGESPDLVLSEAGIKAGLSFSRDSNYYVYASQTASGYTASASKVTYVIRGSVYYSLGIDPASTAKLSFSRKAMSLQDAVKNPTAEKPYIGFSVATSEVAYNVKGATPIIRLSYLNSSGNLDSTTINVPYSGYTTDSRLLYDQNGDRLGYQYFTFKVKNNTKVGQTATVTVTGKGVFKGSVTVGTFLVKPLNVTYIEMITANTTSYLRGHIYAICNDAQIGKGSLDKPNVKLYQAYDNKGKIKLAPLGKNQYKIDTVTKEGKHACTVRFTGPSGDFTFAPGARVSYFCLYDNAKLPSIKSVTIDGVEYTVKNNHIEGYTPTFTGAGIYPAVSAITLNDGTNTQLSGDDWYITYAPNSAAGKNAGNFTLTLKYNTVSRSYPYKGKITLKFDILESGKITL